MSTMSIIIIVTVAIAMVFAIAIFSIHMTNRKRNQNLEAKLKQFKQEDAETKIDEKVTISHEKTVNTNQNLNEEKQDHTAQVTADQKRIPIVEDYDPRENSPKLNLKRQMSQYTSLPKMRYQNNQIYGPRNSDSRQQHDREFEEFLDEHAFSRKILNKDILENIKDLSPELKAIILTNILNKFEDE